MGTEELCQDCGYSPVGCRCADWIADDDEYLERIRRDAMKKRKCNHETKAACRKCGECFACCTGHPPIRRTMQRALAHIRDQPTPYTELQAKYDAVGILLWALREVVGEAA